MEGEAGMRGREGMEGEGEEASALLPQSGDCWNADRSICHPLPSHTHLLSEGPALSAFLLGPPPLFLSSSLSSPGDRVKLVDASFRNPINCAFSHPRP